MKQVGNKFAFVPGMELKVDILVSPYITLNLNSTLEKRLETLPAGKTIGIKAAKNRASHLVAQGQQCALKFPDSRELYGIIRSVSIQNGEMQILVEGA